MRRSRLSKNTEKKTRKTIILSAIGIVIILFILLKFGVEFLVNFSLFVSGSKNQQNSLNGSNQINFVAPPILNPLPTATNSAHLIISGTSAPNETIMLYINNDNIDQIQTDKNGGFTFSESLNTTDNQIKAEAEYKNKKSDFSDVFNVVFKNTQPTLDVSSPSDGQMFKKDQNSVNVTGKTDSGSSVTVNGFWAIMDDNNNFSYNLTLQNGDNEIKIVATDQASNKSEKDLKVNYSQ
jgi:hypothetical protein